MKSSAGIVRCAGSEDGGRPRHCGGPPRESGIIIIIGVVVITIIIIIIVIIVRIVHVCPSVWPSANSATVPGLLVRDLEYACWDLLGSLWATARRQS